MRIRPPTGGSDRLYLLPASGYEVFRPVYDTLAGMGFYNLNPAQIREVSPARIVPIVEGDGEVQAVPAGRLDGQVVETRSRHAIPASRHAATVAGA